MMIRRLTPRPRPRPRLPSVSYSLPGFNLIRNDRASSSHGGVAIYLRSNIAFSVVSSSPQPPAPNTAEYLFLEISLSHTKILLGVFYSPSIRVDYFSSLEHIFETLTPNYNHTIIMGDFNTCLIKNNARSHKLLSLVNSFNLHILPLKETHYFPNCTPSLLDLMIVSSPDMVSKHGQCNADAFSYHDLIFLSYVVRPPKDRSRIIRRRCFNDIDDSKIKEDAAKLDWSPIFSSTIVDDQVEIFGMLLIGLYDVHAPIRPVRVKHLPAPWLTDEIRALMSKKNKAKARYKLNPTTRNHVRYNRARNRCNTVIRDAQRRYIHKSVENENPAKVWKFLKSLGIGKTQMNDIDGNLDINSLNSHFTYSSPFNGDRKINTLTKLSSLPVPDYPSFTFNQFTDSDVKRTIISVTSDAEGCDSIGRKMILPLLDILTPIITHILNSSLSSRVFPSTWKDAFVIPIPKKSKPSNFSDFRPISILPFLSKVLEKLVYSQLLGFLNVNNLLNPLQSGFRKGHSTTTTLTKITDDIHRGMEKRQLTVLTLLDFSNAFNSVDFDILLGILSSLGISPTVIEWFQSYLLGRRQRIRIEDTFSVWCNISAGVPQGGVLSPLLFSIFINSITQSLSCSYHLYADDLQIYTQALLSDLTDAVAVTNKDLTVIHNWSLSYGLTVNPLKTQSIIIGSYYFISRIDYGSLPAINYSGTTIPFASAVKNLGIVFDQCLTWRPQVEAVRRKVFAAYSSLNRFRNFLPIKTKITLAQSLIQSIIDYADISYADLSEELLDKLERLQNLCIRFIYNLRKFDHVSAYRSQLKWLPIRRRKDLHVLSLLYSVLFLPTSPPYLRSCFSFRSSLTSRTLRSNFNLTLDIPSHSSDFLSYSFSVHAVRLWNALPESIKSARTLESFKTQVWTHFISLCA